MSRSFALLLRKGCSLALSVTMVLSISVAGNGAENSEKKKTDKSAAATASVSELASASLLTADTLEQRAFDAVNQERISHGLVPLRRAAEMVNVAREHSQDMLTREYFSHQSPEGKDLRHRLEKHGINNWLRIAENIAYNSGYDDPAITAVEGWMKSPGHRKNILNGDLSESAIGVAVGADGRVYFTQVFARLDGKRKTTGR